MKKQLYLLLFISPFFCKSQNVGIGTTTPTGKLEIHHRSSTVPGLKLVDSTTNFGGVIEFRNMSFTKGMKVSGFSASNFNNGQYLDIRSDSINVMTVKGNGFVGIRDSEPSYPLDVQGDINTTGLLRLNGNAGTSGQILTSSGNADPTWENAAYSNNIRFSYNLTQMGVAASDSLNFNGTPPNYNLNPAMVSVVPGNNARIVINKTGLYHFSGSISMTTANITPEVSNGPTFSIGYWINNKTFSIESAPSIAIIGFVPDDDFVKTFQFSFDVYITAGQTIKFTRFSFSFGGIQSTSGHVNGYLISE